MLLLLSRHRSPSRSRSLCTNWRRMPLKTARFPRVAALFRFIEKWLMAGGPIACICH